MKCFLKVLYMKLIKFHRPLKLSLRIASRAIRNPAVTN